jgi:hypothetical protein
MSNDKKTDYRLQLENRLNYSSYIERLERSGYGVVSMQSMGGQFPTSNDTYSVKEIVGTFAMSLVALVLVSAFIVLL